MALINKSVAFFARFKTQRVGMPKRTAVAILTHNRNPHAEAGIIHSPQSQSVAREVNRAYKGSY